MGKQRTNQPRRKKKKKGDLLLTLALIAAIAVFCFAAYNLFHIYTEYKKGTDEYNHIEQMAVTDRAPEDEELVDAVSEPKPPISVDFDTLKRISPPMKKVNISGSLPRKRITAMKLFLHIQQE